MTTELQLRLDAAFYDLTQEAAAGLASAAEAAYDRDFGALILPALYQYRRGYAEAPAWILVQATEFAPRPLTVERFLVRAVYSSPNQIRALLDLMAAEGWFDREREDYHLTPAGEQLHREVVEHRQSALLAYDTVDDALIERLAALLDRVVTAAITHPDLPDRWCLSHSRNRAPLADSPPLLRLVHYCDDLNALRDDAHLAACGKYNLPSAVREPLALACAGQARTATVLSQQLPFRGFSTAEWQDALDHLEDQGHLTHDRDGYSPTEAALLVRADIEYLTDLYYYAPWSVLSASEMEEAFEGLLSIREATSGAAE